MKETNQKSSRVSGKKFLWMVVGLLATISIQVIGYIIYDAGTSKIELEKIHEQIAEPEWELKSTEKSGNYQCFKRCTWEIRRYSSSQEAREILEHFYKNLEANGSHGLDINNTCIEKSRYADVLTDCYVSGKLGTDKEVYLSIKTIEENQIEFVVFSGFNSHFFGYYENR